METKKITPSEIGDMLTPITLKVSYINCGGCGIFASFLYKELIKFGFKPKILVFKTWSVDRDDIKEYKNSYLPDIQNSRKNNSNPKNGAKSHYMVKLGNFALDCSGDFPFVRQKDKSIHIEKYECTYALLGTMSIEDLDYLIGIKWAWNPEFNRRHSKRIEKLIKKQLAKILN